MISTTMILRSLSLFFCVVVMFSACTTSQKKETLNLRTQKQTHKNYLTHEKTIHLLKKAGIKTGDIRCNNRVDWLDGVDDLAKDAARAVAQSEDRILDEKRFHKNSRIILGYMVRLVFQYSKNQNLGAMVLNGQSFPCKDKKGKAKRCPLVIFRSAITTDAKDKNSCLRSLLGAGKVKHVVNLYTGHFPFHEFIKAEKEVTQKCGASHFGADSEHAVPWREMIRSKESYEKNKKKSMKLVAELINTSILNPNHKPPEGNIYLHCGGGMHRSGMVFGILQKCVNKASAQELEKTLKKHVAYKSEHKPGGFEEGNLRFIREFDCSLIKPPRGDE